MNNYIIYYFCNGKYGNCQVKAETKKDAEKLFYEKTEYTGIGYYKLWIIEEL